MGAACVIPACQIADLACESHQQKKSRRIDRQIEIEKEKEILKILLLGPAESGKSTVLKQMKIIHAEGYSEEDLLAKRNAIYHNVVNGIVCAVAEAQNRKLPLSERMQRDADIASMFVELLRVQEVHPIPTEEAYAVARLYASPLINDIINKMQNTSVDDAGRFFLKHFDRIRMHDYVPTVHDVLQSRVITQGCIMMELSIRMYTVYDVGGQRSQRKKWLHIFDNVDSVLFITSLSEYNQTLIEEKETNRMRESLALFGSIIRNTYFKKTAIILFLNKMDLFAEKVTTVPITCIFPRYKGSKNFHESSEHIKKRFMHKNSNAKRLIYTHFTCATDTKRIQVVIDNVINVIIQKKLNEIGIQ